jgi:hypothetical protein
VDLRLGKEQGQRAHWVTMARWAASAMLIYFVIESSVSSG